MENKKNSRRKFYIKTTEECNLKCLHCYNGTSSSLYFDPDKTIDFLNKYIQNNPNIFHYDIAFHGGEPLLAPIENMRKIVFFFKGQTQLTSSFSIQTNLIHNLTPEKKDFLLSLDAIGTSWDYDLRVASKRELEIWEKNVSELIKEKKLHVTICLSAKLIKEITPKEIIEKMIAYGFSSLLFERLTPSGVALENKDIFPNLSDQDNWLHQMLLDTKKYAFYEKIENTFLSTYANILYYGKPIEGQRRCRQCESSMITISADGSLSGCPDSGDYDRSKYQNISNVKSYNNKIFNNKLIINELIGNIDKCSFCPLVFLCKEDCHKYKECNAPKKMMRTLISWEEDKAFLAQIASV